MRLTIPSFAAIILSNGSSLFPTVSSTISRSYQPTFALILSDPVCLIPLRYWRGQMYPQASSAFAEFWSGVAWCLVKNRLTLKSLQIIFVLRPIFRFRSLCSRVVTWICQNWYMDFSKLIGGFVSIDTWISLNCYMGLSKLIHGFLQVFTWICQSCYMHFCPLPNKTKLKLDQNFKACWSFCFEVKVLNLNI